MFNFLKRIFAKKEKESISQNNLDSWFDNQENLILSNVNEKINQLKEKLNNEINTAKQNLETLQNAELHNPNISLKEKQFMQGNREAYIKKTNLLINNIKIPEDIHEISNFCLNIDNQITEFGKSTFKQYHILQEFFSHYADAIANNIKNIDNIIREIKKIIETTDLTQLKETKTNINHLKNKTAQKQELKNKLNELEEKEQKQITLIQETEEEINDFKETYAYKNLLQLKQEKEETSNRLEEHKNNLLHNFAILEHSLKKFVRISFEDETLLENYINDPIKTLVSDYELKIIKLLNNLEKTIQENKIFLKDKKRIKTIAIIKTLTQEYFTNFLTKYNALIIKNKEIKNQLLENTTTLKLNELKIKLNKLNEEKQQTQKTIENTKQDIEKINLNQLKTNLQEQLSKIIKKQINII